MIKRLKSIEEMTQGMTFDGVERNYNVSFVRENGEEESFECSAAKVEDFQIAYDEFKTDEEHDDILDQRSPIIAITGISLAPEPAATVRQKAPDGVLTINNGYGDEKVTLRVDTYQYGGGLYVGLECADPEERGMPFGDVTKNLTDQARQQGMELPPYTACIDTNNMPGLPRMLETYGLARPVPDTVNGGQATVRSGYCEYPVMRFDGPSLDYLCPEGMDTYRKKVAERSGKSAGTPDWKKNLMQSMGITDQDLEDFDKSGKGMGE